MNEFESTGKPGVTQSVRSFIDQGHQTAEVIRGRVSDVRGQVKHGGSTALERTRSYVNAHPLKAVGIAFGVGYIAMRIQTSPLLKLGLLGGLVYLGRGLVRERTGTRVASQPEPAAYQR